MPSLTNTSFLGLSHPSTLTTTLITTLTTISKVFLSITDLADPAFFLICQTVGITHGIDAFLYQGFRGIYTSGISDAINMCSLNFLAWLATSTLQGINGNLLGRFGAACHRQGRDGGFSSRFLLGMALAAGMGLHGFVWYFRRQVCLAVTSSLWDGPGGIRRLVREEDAAIAAATAAVEGEDVVEDEDVD